MASRHWAQKWFGWACKASAKCRLACVDVAAFVLLEAGQEVVECPIRLDAIGRRPFLLRPLGVAGPLEAGSPPQVIGMSRLAEQEDGAFQDLEAPRELATVDDSPGRGWATASASTISIS